MAIYIYICRLGHETEEMWKGVEDSSIPCPLCGETAHRADCSGLPAIRGETVGKSYATSRTVSDFQEASTEIGHAYSEAEKREGQPIKGPNLYKAGMRRAREMREK